MLRILETNPELKPFESDLKLRMSLLEEKRRQLLGKGKSLGDFANAHRWYGFHRQDGGWVYREWAPAADQLFLTGDFNSWHWLDHPMKKLEGGSWELFLPGDTIGPGSRVMTIVRNGEQLTQHLPLYTRRAIQDWVTQSWCCEVVDDVPYAWTDEGFRPEEPPLIYEAHVGMSSEENRIATYREFADNVLPHVIDAGYNTVQLMAVMEHPYYGSFGYQVSNFFACSSRFGYPDDLKYLINKAHSMGIRVLLDVVHSHAVGNTLEGINRFDGTDYQFFHAGGEGDHPAWGTKLFDYGKPEVLHFLLSNLKFWMEEFHFDGFRFDGVTSMLYHSHGLGENFRSLADYFTMNTDTQAVTYLQLANQLIAEVKPGAVTIAEDMSGMPGMCNPVEDGGIGFGYRLAMGIPDLWIRCIKERRDEDWNLGGIWTEMVFRNAPTIAYVESHDQALVGDKTVMFRLADAAMYTDMEKKTHTPVIDRAVALHKMIRLLTMAAGGNGYLCFMGNEFGHPEWIDFPRPGNGNSFKYCRRQWSLMNNPLLKYEWLYRFDQAMLRAAKENAVFSEGWPKLDRVHEDMHLLCFERGDLLFAFNFSPDRSITDCVIPVRGKGSYEVLFSTDDPEFGGFDQIAHRGYETEPLPKDFREPIPKDLSAPYRKIQLYLPARTAVVLKRVE